MHRFHYVPTSETYKPMDRFVYAAANERRRYIVTSPLIGWVHTQNDPSVYYASQELFTELIIFFFPVQLGGDIGMPNIHLSICPSVSLGYGVSGHFRGNLWLNSLQTWWASLQK